MAVDYSFPLMSGPADAHGLDQRVTVTVETGPGTITVFIGGELDLVSLPVLAEELAQVPRDPPAQLVFDLAATTFADVGTIRVLARAGPPGRRPVLRHPRPGIRRILELTGLDAYCEIEA